MRVESSLIKLMTFYKAHQRALLPHIRIQGVAGCLQLGKGSPENQAMMPPLYVIQLQNL